MEFLTHPRENRSTRTCWERSGDLSVSTTATSPDLSLEVRNALRGCHGFRSQLPDWRRWLSGGWLVRQRRRCRCPPARLAGSRALAVWPGRLSCACPPSPGLARCRPLELSPRSEEHTSELQSHVNLVCRLLLEKKNVTHLHTRLVAAEDQKSTT